MSFICNISSVNFWLCLHIKYDNGLHVVVVVLAQSVVAIFQFSSSFVDMKYELKLLCNVWQSILKFEKKGKNF